MVCSYWCHQACNRHWHGNAGMLDSSVWVWARESNPCPGPPDCTSKSESCGMVRTTGWFDVLVQLWWSSPDGHPHTTVVPGFVLYLFSSADSPFHCLCASVLCPVFSRINNPPLVALPPPPPLFPAFLHLYPNLVLLILVLSNPGLIWHYWHSYLGTVGLAILPNRTPALPFL